MISIFEKVILGKTLRDRDRYLEQTPFCFLPWGCPWFQVRHIQFEFPATFDGKMQKGLICCLPDSNPGPTACEASMLPQDLPVRYYIM